VNMILGGGGGNVAGCNVMKIQSAARTTTAAAVLSATALRCGLPRRPPFSTRQRRSSGMPLNRRTSTCPAEARPKFRTASCPNSQRSDSISARRSSRKPRGMRHV
jgi:hypothetical protein